MIITGSNGIINVSGDNGITQRGINARLFGYKITNNGLSIQVYSGNEMVLSDTIGNTTVNGEQMTPDNAGDLISDIISSEGGSGGECDCSDYLPLEGGKMQGDIVLNNKRIWLNDGTQGSSSAGYPTRTSFIEYDNNSDSIYNGLHIRHNATGKAGRVRMFLDKLDIYGYTEIDENSPNPPRTINLIASSIGLATNNVSGKGEANTRGIYITTNWNPIAYGTGKILIDTSPTGEAAGTNGYTVGNIDLKTKSEEFPQAEGKAYYNGNEIATVKDIKSNQNIFYSGDLSVTGNILTFDFGTVTAIVTKLNDSTIVVELSSSEDITIHATKRYMTASAPILSRAKYDLTSEKTEIDQITVGSYILLEYWIKKENQLYYITAGADSINLYDAWVNIITYNK